MCSTQHGIQSEPNPTSTNHPTRHQTSVLPNLAVQPPTARSLAAPLPLPLHHHCRIANQVHHRYDDKFGLAKWCTNISIASQLNCLSRLGLSQDHVTILQGWVEGGSSVSLRFRAEETCDFSCEVSRGEATTTTTTTTTTTITGLAPSPATFAPPTQSHPTPLPNLQRSTSRTSTRRRSGREVV